MESQALKPLEKIASLPRSRLPRELFFVGFSYVIYSQVRGLAANRSLDAFANAYQVINLEEKLGVFRELSLQQFVISRGDLIDFFNLVYFYGLFPLLLPTALWLYLRRPRIYDLARNAFLVSGAIAVCFYVLMPTAPPRLIGMGFLDTLGTSLTPAYGSIPGVNHYAAMPSMHVGWNFLLAVAIYLALEGWTLRILILALPVLMFTATVVTGNHYFLDGVLGVCVAATGLLLASQIERRRHQQRQVLAVQPAATYE
jgi:membrane-associated phospholipid phosphatase